jgi:pimeloyl-ACP methyl ester carboxylesterase
LKSTSPADGERHTFVGESGAEIAYSSCGSGDPGFVLIHGWLCDKTVMEGLAHHLSRRGRVVNVDLAGHGESGQPTLGYSSSGFVADIRLAARHGGVSDPILVGHSMGGRLALAVAESHPELVAGLVLLDVAVVEEGAYVRARRGELDAPGWRDSLVARSARLWLTPPRDRLRRRIAATMSGASRELAAATLDVADAVSAASALRNLTVPVLYIGASTPKETAATLHELNPRLVYGQVVGSGHFVQVDAGPQVNAMIDRFCAISWPLAPSRSRSSSSSSDSTIRSRTSRRGAVSIGAGVGLTKHGAR